MRRTGWRRRGRSAAFLTAAAGTLCALAATATAAPSAAEQTADFAAQVADRREPAHQTQSASMPSPAGKRLDAVTATSPLLFDAIGDNEGLAPDLAEMFAFSSDDGRFTVGITLTDNALVTGDFVATYVNTDGNPATGSPVFGGADVAVGILGEIGPDIVGASRWNGSSFEAGSFPSLVSFASGTTDEVWSISAAELGIAPGTPTTLYFGTLYSGLYDDYFDFAPEPGAPPLAFTVGGLTPPPAPVIPTTPTAPTAPTAPTTPLPTPTGGVASVAKPVGLRTFKVKKASNGLKLRLSWVKGDGRIVWSVRARTVIDGRVQTRETHGAGRAGNRDVLRLLRLPSAWKGRRVVVRLQVDDDRRTIVRSRTVVY